MFLRFIFCVFAALPFAATLPASSQQLLSTHLASPAEKLAMASALTRMGTPGVDSSQAVHEFLDRYPESGYKAYLLADLASSYRATGRFSKAIESYEEAWRLTRAGTTPNERLIANWALGELLAIHSHLGHRARLLELFAEAKGRDLHGRATEQYSTARESLWLKEHHPEESARCGPMALERIAREMGIGEDARKMLTDAPATSEGMSLDRLQSLAERAGMAMIAVRRDAGADFIVPSVVHWKVDHYSAMVRRKVENGREFFLLENPLFEREMWVSREALEEETSGYYLVPEQPLPSGWHSAAPREMARVWGKCFEGIMDTTQTMDDADEIGGPNGPTGCPDCNTEVGFGMATYSFHTVLTSLHIVDTPLRYSPPLGPSIGFHVTYDQRDASQPAIPTYSNLGNKWTFDWVSFVMDRGAANSQSTVFLQGGGQEIYQPENATSIPGQIYTNYFNHDYESHAQLLSNTGVGGVLMNYQRLLPDGSQELFSLIQNDPVSGNRLIFLTQMIDPAGNTVTINYDSQYRVVSVTDAIGQVTTLSYELSSDPLKVTKVTDPFGRSAVLTYNSQDQLASITDPLGIVSQFSYGDSDFINTLTTPYGATQFTTGVAPGSDPVGGINRSLEATDPMGGTEHLEFLFYDPTQSGVYGTSFYWSKRAWATAPEDPTAAFLINWMLDDHISVGLRHYQQLPNESRVSYSYASTTGRITQDGTTSGEPDFIGLPVQIQKTLDDGSTQLVQLSYNEQGHTTQITDAANRVTSMVYDPTGIDLLEIHNVSDNNALIGRFTYNNQHLPLTYTDASGQVTTYTYNLKGKLLTSTDAEGETTAYSYDSQSYLTTITGPLAGATTTFTHDKFGRTQSITDSQGYVLTFAYDALDHPIQVTYPDGTSDQVTYSNLDPVLYQDREGRAWQTAYDALRRPLTYTDPLGNSTSLTWCACGDLSQMTDANGNITSWQRDITSRVISKTYADGSSATYSYGPMSGRLIAATDPNGQTTNYQYTVDNNPQQLSFSNVQAPTASISYTYDANYNRAISMQDGIGTTTYAYNPPGQLGALQVASVSGPWGNSSVTYSYDALGRVLDGAVDGAATSWTYDLLSRVTGETSPLGSFNSTFVGATNELSQLTYPNGQAINLTYYGNLGDQRLQQIANAAAGPGVGSEFNYSYAAAGEMQSWSKITAAATGAWQFTYDAAIHLTGVASGGSGLSDYAYAYDPAANRTSEQSDLFANGAAFNNLNQMVTSQQGASSNQLSYDANGNLLGDGTRTFEWDGLNRLTAVNIGSHRSVFSYDGLGRRAGIMEMDDGDVVSNQQLVWCGDNLCELRDSVSGTTRRFYAEGESDVVGGTEIPYYYTFDHLGSIRELSDSTGALVTSYDYDPFGRLFSTGGSRDATFGYAGYFVHAPSGLYLTKYRAYDPNLGTWLSRDPIGEAGGTNLYGYVGGNPISSVDALGLSPDTQMDIFESGGGAGAGQPCPCKKSAWYRLSHIFDAGLQYAATWFTTNHPVETALASLPAAGIAWRGMAATGAAINLTTDIPAAWTALVKPLPGYQPVFVHFSLRTGYFGLSEAGPFNLTSLYVASRIVSQPQYANMPIQVVACDLGADAAATENLAAALGRQLAVPMARVDITNAGRLSVGDPGANAFPYLWRLIPRR